MCRPPPELQASRRILELALPGQHDGLLPFLHQWRAWRRSRPRSTHLHYVLILPQVPNLMALGTHLAANPAHRFLGVLVRHLVRQWGLAGGLWAPGFQRLELDKAQVLLTVCIGPLKAMLKAQNFLANEVLVSGANLNEDADEWDRWTAKTLAQRCHSACQIHLLPAAHGVLKLLGPAGFTIKPSTASAAWRGEFSPRWAVKPSPWAASAALTPPGTCLVVGAGLAGAATAAALARRGWQVQVLDAGAAANAGDLSGAADLPLALFCPHVSKNDAPLSRLVRAGISLLTQRLPNRLVPGRDWALTGVAENRAGQTWHAQAGWVKPQALIRALLAGPGIEINPPARVHALRFEHGLWQALDASGASLARAQLVVLAAAGGTAELLANLQRPTHQRNNRVDSLHPVHGQISWAYHSAHDTAMLPRHPVNGHGHLSAHIPQQKRRAWYVGATYETGSAGETGLASNSDAAVAAAGHARNFLRLQTLAPELALHLAGRFNSGKLHSWRGTRFATRDRLPLVGPWQTNPQLGLWVNTGLGSRGLSWCLLNAELLAAQLHGEPLPIDAQLAGKLAL